MVVKGSGGSQRLLCINPTTVIVVWLLELGLLLGCDNEWGDSVSRMDEMCRIDEMNE